MMKKIVSLLLSMTLLLAFAACDNSGNSEEIKEKTAYALTGVTVIFDGEEQNGMQIDYNKDGTVAEIVTRNAGEIMTRQTYEYDSENNTIVAVTYDADGEETSRTTSKRDEDGKVRENVTVANGVTTQNKNQFDENGKLIQTIAYDERGEQLSVTVFLYDEDGNKIRERTTDANGTEINDRQYKYDDDGNLIETTYAVSGNALFHYIYKYEGGKLVERSDEQGKWIYRFSYNDAGNLSKIEVVSDGEAQGTMEFSYKKMTLPEEKAEDLEEYMETFMDLFLAN